MRGKGKDIVQMAQKRQRILEAAFQLFSEKGIDPVTMPDIAEASEVSRASLYRYYNSKLELVVAIGAQKWNDYIASRGAALSRDALSAMTVAEYLKWYMDSFIDLYRNHRDILRFNYYFNSYVRNEMPTQAQKQPYNKVVDDLALAFHDVYVRGTEEGSIRSDIPEKALFSSTFHIMLAAVTRYAMGLVYLPDADIDPESELVLLENALLHEYTRKD